MKKTLITALILSPIALMAQSDFTLKGNTKTIKDGTTVYLVYANAGQRVTDSATVQKGTFEIKGKIKDATSANLFNGVNPMKNRKANTKNLDYLSLYVEPGKMTFNSKDSLTSAVFTEGNINKDNSKYNLLIKPFSEREKALNVEYTGYTDEQKKDEALVGALIEKFNTVNKEKTPVIIKFIKENPKSYISLVQTNSLVNNDDASSQVEGLFAGLAPELKTSKIGQSLQKTIEAAKKTAIGVTAMDFTQNDPDGKPVKLSDFKGKYVLIDFWASWCGPCRSENPNVVEAFQKFKDKNFTILGVSLDGGNTKTTKEAWLKAIEDDKLTWTHVSDMNGWNNEVSSAWGIRAIPANFLIDPQGKIVAKGLRGKALHDKLAELLN